MHRDCRGYGSIAVLIVWRHSKELNLLSMGNKYGGLCIKAFSDSGKGVSKLWIQSSSNLFDNNWCLVSVHEKNSIVLYASQKKQKKNQWLRMIKLKLWRLWTALSFTCFQTTEEMDRLSRKLISKNCTKHSVFKTNNSPPNRPRCVWKPNDIRAGHQRIIQRCDWMTSTMCVNRQNCHLDWQKTLLMSEWHSGNMNGAVMI